MHERRLEMRKQVTTLESTFKNLQSLESLEGLQSLERLQRLERLQIQNKSFEEVIIETPIEETVIYLDPPYL